MHKSNLIMGSVLLILSLVTVFFVIPTFTIPVRSELDIAPSLVPTVAVSVMGLLSISLIFRSWIGLRNGAAIDRDDEEFKGELTGLTIPVLKNLLIWAVFAVLTIIGLKFVGFYLVAPIAIASLMWFSGSRNLISIVIVSIAFPVLTAQLVWAVFTVSLP